jgi:hypothetical protein
MEKKRRVDEEIMRVNHGISSILEKNWNFSLKVNKSPFYSFFLKKKTLNYNKKFLILYSSISLEIQNQALIEERSKVEFSN